MCATDRNVDCASGRLPTISDIQLLIEAGSTLVSVRTEGDTEVLVLTPVIQQIPETARRPASDSLYFTE